MHIGRSYRLIDFALWSRRGATYMVVVSLVAIGAYLAPGIAGFSVPWAVVLVLGTTVSLIAGFKNSQVLARSTEALQAFAQITATSRIWTAICRDFTDAATARELIYRHLAWLTALRFALRRPMPWELAGQSVNVEYRRRFAVEEDPGKLADELRRLIPQEADRVLGTAAPALALLDLQLSRVNALFKAGALPAPVYGEFMKAMRDLEDQQARCDRIKNTPYPRQYAAVSSIAIAIFCTLLPFGAVPLFAGMASLGGVWGPLAIWLTVPFSTLLGWVYMSIDQVGENTANPFEGSANDVPISQICRDIEIELRTALGETEIPPPLQPVNGIAT